MKLQNPIKARGHEIKELISRHKEFTNGNMKGAFNGESTNTKFTINGIHDAFEGKLIERPTGVISFTLGGKHSLIVRRFGTKEWKLVI